MSHIVFFFRQLLSLLVYVWLVTLVLTVAALWSAVSLERSGKIGSDQVRLVLIASALTLLSIPIVAIVFWADSAGHTAPGALGSLMVGLVTLAYAMVIVVALFHAKGHRLALAAIATLLGWVNVGGIIVALMAVTADWL